MLNLLLCPLAFYKTPVLGSLFPLSFSSLFLYFPLLDLFDGWLWRCIVTVIRAVQFGHGVLGFFGQHFIPWPFRAVL